MRVPTTIKRIWLIKELLSYVKIDLFMYQGKWNKVKKRIYVYRLLTKELPKN